MQMQISEHEAKQAKPWPRKAAGRSLRGTTLAIALATLSSPEAVEADNGRNRAAPARTALLGTLSARPLPPTQSQLKVGVLACNTKSAVHKGRRKALSKVIKKHPELDVLLAGPEWLFLPKTGLYKKEDLKRLRSFMEAETRGNPMLVFVGSMPWAEGKFSHNTALIVSDGKSLTYHKQRSGGDSVMASRRNQQSTGESPVWVPGDQLGLISWRDRLVGFEMCADHHAGVLRNAGVTNTDLHVIQACDLNNIGEGHMATKTGASAVLCDGGGQRPALVYQRLGAKGGKYDTKGIPSVAEELIAGKRGDLTEMVLYSFDIPLPAKP